MVKASLFDNIAKAADAEKYPEKKLAWIDVKIEAPVVVKP